MIVRLARVAAGRVVVAGDLRARRSYTEMMPSMTQIAFARRPGPRSLQIESRILQYSTSDAPSLLLREPRERAIGVRQVERRTAQDVVRCGRSSTARPWQFRADAEPSIASVGGARAVSVLTIACAPAASRRVVREVVDLASALGAGQIVEPSCELADGPAQLTHLAPGRKRPSQ